MFNYDNIHDYYQINLSKLMLIDNTFEKYKNFLVTYRNKYKIILI